MTETSLAAQHVTYEHQYRRCSRICATCKNGPGHGPYIYAFWRENGKVKSRYIGLATPKQQEEEHVYIYALCEPTLWQEVRYIGVTRNPIKRLNQHLCRVNLIEESPKAQWLRKLVAKGLRPVMIILEEMLTTDRHTLEQMWIQRYKAQGATLTNVQHNDDSPAE